MIRGLIRIRGVILLAVLAGRAAAQDVGQAWMDEAVQRLEEDAVPLSLRDIELHLSAGELLLWDSNIHLRERDERSDTILVTCGRARMSYAERNFDVEGDLQVNYNRYFCEDRASGHEERFFGRGRFQEAAVAGELALILRRESDPFTDTEVADRIERVVGNAYPRVTARLSDVLGAEAEANLQVVRFGEEAFRRLDNRNVRAALGLVWSAAPWIDLLAQGGYQGIVYEESPDPPNVRGGYARLGGRGDLTEALSLDVRAGVAHLESGDLPGSSGGAGLTTADVDLHLRYEASERLAFLGDYARRFGFSSGSSPFQVTDRVVGRAEFDLLEEVVLR